MPGRYGSNAALVLLVGWSVFLPGHVDALPKRHRPAAAPGRASEIAASPAAPADTTASRSPTSVLRTRVHDAIGPASAHFIIGALARAEANAAECFVLELDTPGGLDDSMRDLVKRILAADVPVVVYVAPSGARAASAGFFILEAAHIAAMAPGTNTGAAHPVNLGGGQTDATLSEKIENDAASFMRALAQKRQRNVEWAESAVRESASISAEEALQKHVVDLVAPDLHALLQQIDGRKVEVVTGTRLLRTRSARVQDVEMGWRDQILTTIANPNIAYLLLMLGSLGIVVELWNPGAIFPGVVGAISLLLAFFALQVLPVNHAGLLLLLLGIILLVLEVKVTSHGLLTLGGIASLVLGSLLLFEVPGSVAHVALGVILLAVGLTSALFLFVVGKGLGAQRRKPVTGLEGMIGQVGICDSVLDPEGKVFVHGEYWNARAGERLESGARVEVVAVEGRQLLVRRH